VKLLNTEATLENIICLWAWCIF